MATPTTALEHPEAGAIELIDVLSALSDPSRLAIVRQLADGSGEGMACQAVGGDLAKSTRSHHLKTLREAGVIRSVPRGRERFLSLRREDLDGRFPGLLDAVLTDGKP